MSEYVYCLSNPNYIENLYKIGFTNNPLKRVEELYSTGVPSDFEIEFIIQTPHGKLLEQIIHNKLKFYRNNSHREFFRISMTTLKNILENEMQLALITDVKNHIENSHNTCIDANDIISAEFAIESEKETYPFICEKCCTGFKSKQNLQKHTFNSVCLKKQTKCNDKQKFILLSIEKLKKEILISNNKITEKLELLEKMTLDKDGV
jgi:hypothetical protein